MFILLIIVLCNGNIFHCEFIKFDKNLNSVIGFSLVCIEFYDFREVEISF